MVATHGFQCPMRWSSRAHVVLGMNFEEAALFAFGENCGEVLPLEAGPREACDRKRWKAERICRKRCRFDR